MYKKIKNITSSIGSIIGEFKPQIGIIIGSGLSSLCDDIEVVCKIEYKDIEGFPLSTVEGHKGEFLFGRIAGKDVVVQNGRFHYYEGYTPDEVVLPVRVMRELGVEYLFISNAAGGINREFSIGDLMLITDHINFIPNPLIGKNDPQIGERFPSLTNCYDKYLREKAWQTSMNLRSGVYAALTGPTYETRAEVNFLRVIGADAVGMSTVPEVIAACHAGVKVFAVSVITNICDSDTPPSHQEVIEAGDLAASNLKELFTNIIELM